MLVLKKEDLSETIQDNPEKATIYRMYSYLETK